MGVGVRQRAAIDRLEAIVHAHHRVPSPAPARPVDEDASLCPELDCLRGWVSKDTAAAAGRRAFAIGTGADRVLISAGALDEDIYVRALADSLGIAFEPLDGMPRAACPLDDARLMDAPAAGMMPLQVGDALRFVVAPHGLMARWLTEVINLAPHLAQRFSLTTAARLQSYATRHAADAIADRANRALADAWPELSASPPGRRLSLIPATAIGAVGCAALLAAPVAVRLAFDVFLTLIFLAWMGLRVAGTLIWNTGGSRPARVRDRRLPIYTILVPLYREAASLEELVFALRRIDYPPEKLDIKLIVEPDDYEMHTALARLSPGPPFEVIVAPQGGPRTKPKALNAALPFARGTFTVVYDAEDRPEPGQLRAALDAFHAHDNRLACVQASLTIDNTADNWLTALYTAEYAGQFDVFLPALSQLRMPLPLGGSSNHFRTATLRAVGAWDPYNVTEDADLGLRLARFGYRAIAIAPTTYEEAPSRLGPWLRQRTRWFKGWMQTWLVHMRAPRKLCRELGLGAFLTVQLIVGGNVLASLVHPLLIVWLIRAVAADKPLWSGTPATALVVTTLVSGYLVSALLCAVGLVRRRVAGYAWVLLLMPLHWLLLTVAAWRALFQLLRDPYRWEKTEHGLARTSRRKMHRPPDDVIAEILKPPQVSTRGGSRARKRQTEFTE